MNFVKRSLIKGGTKGGVGVSGEVEALGGVKALLLPMWDFSARL